VPFTICFVGVWLLCISTVSSDPTVKPITAQEPQLRAAVILGIVRFSSWPNQDVGEKFLNVCTLGNPIAGQGLMPISKSYKVADKTLVIHVLVNYKKTDSCDVIIYGQDLNVLDFSRSLQRTAAQPILTICDGCKTLDTETTIKLIQRNNRIGFEVNLGNANKQGIIISSSLLELASEVRR